jgi:hypothetical protein
MSRRKTEPGIEVGPRCHRCRRRLRSIEQLIIDGWNDVFDNGRHVGSSVRRARHPS